MNLLLSKYKIYYSIVFNCHVNKERAVLTVRPEKPASENSNKLLL